MRKIIEIIKKKWLRDTFLSIVLIVIIFAIYYAINFAVEKINMQDIDLTTDKIYSISESTKEKLANIDKDVTIQLINFSNYEYLLDFANKYTQISNKVTVEEISNIASRSDLMAKYNLTVDDSLIVIKADEREEVLTINDLYTYDYTTYEQIDLTEEALTNAIVGVTIEEKPKIYFLEGHNYYQDAYFTTIRNTLTQEANEVENLNILIKGEVPEDCDVLVITTLKEDITELEKAKILEYAGRGGKILMACDPNILGVDLTNFKQILKEYGITIKDAILFEQDENKIMVGFPEFILSEIPSYSPIAQNLNMNMNICVIDAGRIEFEDQEKLHERGITYTVLAQTSERAFLRSDLQISTTSKTNKDQDAASSIVGAIVTKSEEGKPTTRLVIYSNAIFAQDQRIPLDPNYYYYTYAVNMANNKDVFANSIAYLTQRTDTITIRKNHDNVNYTVTEAQHKIILAIIFILPVLIIVAGIIVWQIRRRK